MEITFTADSGFLAVLKSFDMGGWPDADYDITSVQIWDGSGVVLYDSGPVTIEGAFDGGPRHTHFEFSPELEAEVLRIRIDCLALGGACWNNGIDNVAYGQKQAGPTPPPAGVAPLADAGPDQPNVESGSDVNLDGSGSSDEDEDTLSFSWAFVSRPAGSTATLAGANTATPSFTPDKLGNYSVELTVDDGSDTDTDTVAITVVDTIPPTTTTSVSPDPNV